MPSSVVNPSLRRVFAEVLQDSRVGSADADRIIENVGENQSISATERADIQLFVDQYANQIDAEALHKLSAVLDSDRPLPPTEANPPSDGLPPGPWSVQASQENVQTFRPYLDLRNPSPSLQQDYRAMRTLSALAQNPYLNLDSDPGCFSLQEWQQALRYLPTWPPEMQKEIAGLRRHFVQVPPPTGVVLDLTTLPGALWSDPDVLAAVGTLTEDPSFDLDGYPGLVSERELVAAEQAAPYLPPSVHRGLIKLREQMVQSGEPVGERDCYTTPSGAKIEVYPNSQQAQQHVERIVAGLARNPSFAQVLAGLNIIVTPPSRGLECIPGLGEMYKDAEGVASWQVDPRVCDRPFVAIRHDSVCHWDLGIAHELIHQLHFNLPNDVQDRIKQVWQDLRLPDAQDDPYANEFEMLAFFGQWYLAGFGGVIEQLEPQLHGLLSDVLGDARVDARDLSQDRAWASLTSLLQWFRSGEQLG